MVTHIQIFFRYTFFVILIASIVFVSTFQLHPVEAATFTWTQSSWAGGVSGSSYPVHPTHQTGWAKYASKDSLLVAAGGGLSMPTSSQASVSRTSDTDFSGGSNSSTQVIGSGSSAGVGLIVAPGNSVGYWPFDEGSGATTSDASGHGNNGTLINGATWTTGRYGGGLNFDGANDAVTIPPELGVYDLTTDLSVFLWVKTTDAAWDAFGPNVANGSWGISTSGCPAGKIGGYIGLTWRCTPTAVHDGSWHSVGLTLSSASGGTLKFYIDGQQDGSTVTSAGSFRTPAQTGASDIRIGNDLTSTFGFAGDLDEARIYNRVLSPSEVSSLYSAGTSGTYTSAVVDTGTTNSLTTLTYNKTAPLGTTVTVDIRAGDTGVPDGSWTSWQTDVASSGSITGLGDHRYVQYRVNLTSPDIATTPTLDDITINYHVPDLSLVSSAYNSTDATNAISRIQWVVSTSSEASVKFQIRTAPDSSSAPGSFTSWMGPDGTSESYFTDASGGDTIPNALKDGLSDQWFQYKAILSSTDATQTPVVTSVTVQYVVNAQPEFDPNYPSAAAGGVSAVQNSDGTVSINYSVRDPDTSTGTLTPGYITPSFEYSLNGGSSWTAIASSTLGLTALNNKAVDQTNFTPYTATWSAASSTPGVYYATSTKVRVTINDNEGAHNTATQTSAGFSLDTTTPVINAYVLNVGAGTITLNLTDNTALSYRLSNNADMSADGLNGTSGAWQAVGGTSFSQSVNWLFSGSSPSVYLQVKDSVNNQAARSAVAPQSPQSYQLKDVSNVGAGNFQEFIFWQVYSSGAGSTFASYKVERSSNAGASYSTLTSIADQNLNYYLDGSVASSTTYTYRVQIVDSDGDTSAFTPAVSDLPNGQGGTDVTAPVISDVEIAETQSTWVRITWTTDELANSIVQYSADPDLTFGTSATVNTMAVSHSATITNLTPNTQYHIRVRSADILNNLATDSNGGDGYTVTTTNGPIISNVTTPRIGDRTATVSWDTNVDASSIVVYADNSGFSNPLQTGTNSLVGGATSSPSFSHQVDLSDLIAGRTYYYYVRSTDAQNNETTDSNSGAYYSFHTTNDIAAPVISNISAPVVGATTAVIVWQTDELATSQIAYGTSSSTLSTFTALDATLSIYHIVTVTGLTAETTYYFAAHSKDQADNEGISDVETMTTPQPQDVLVATLVAAAGSGGYSGGRSDTTPPVLSDVVVKDIGAFKATIAWHINEQARSFVEVTDDQKKTVTYGATDVATDPNIVLNNLTLGGTYTFVAKSIDLGGNIAAAPAQSFTTKFAAEANDELNQVAGISDLQNKLSDVIESSLPSLLPPTISDIAVTDITEEAATVTWKTNIKGSTLVALAQKGEYHEDTEKPYPVEQSGQDEAVKVHSLELRGLTPNTLYHYQVRTKTLVGTLGKGPDKTFTTKAGLIKPFISGVTNTSFIVSWTTNEPSTSIVEYKDVATGSLSNKNDATLATKHEVTIDNLPQGKTYEVRVSGLNADKNELSGEPVKVVMSRDVTAPVLSGFKVESFMVPGRVDRVQTVVTWQTDEPANSIVEYNEGAGKSSKGFANKYENIKDFAVGHTVALLNLKPETVYELQVTTVDKFGNKTVFGPRTVITPKQAQSIIDVIFSNFNDTFKFVDNIN